MTDQVSTAEQPTGTSAEATQQPQTTKSSPQLQPAGAAASAPATSAAAAGRRPLNGAQPRACDPDRLANWLVGVEPQDVRFPVNICQLAFTANYFAALTSDRRKIYVNRRSPGWHGNCKRRCIDFPAADWQQRPNSVVSFDHGDTLCVVFRRRIEFHSLASLTRVGAYETAAAEVAAVGARGGRSPLGALWCAARPSSPPEAAFTVWTDRTEAPRRALLLGPSVVGRPERFLCFYWTSEDTVLLVSRQEEAERPQRPDRQQPLVFCAYDTAGRRPMQRLCRRSVHSARQFCLSPDSRLLLLSGGSQHQLLEAATLRQLLALPRRPAGLTGSALETEPVAVTNSGDLLLLLQSELLVHRRGGLQGSPARYDLDGLLLRKRCGGSSGCCGDCRVYAVGELGALVVCEQSGGAGGGGVVGGGQTADGDRPAQHQLQQQECCLVALVDLNGNVIMRAEWPRTHVHLVSDDLLVLLRSLSTKPFSAAHACIFDFNSPVARRSCWAAEPAEADTAATHTATTGIAASIAVACSVASTKP